MFNVTRINNDKVCNSNAKYIIIKELAETKINKLNVIIKINIIYSYMFLYTVTTGVTPVKYSTKTE